MSDSIERNRSSHGPLTEAELLGLLDRGYADASRRFFARTWDVEEENIEAVAQAVSGDIGRDIDLTALEPTARAVFGILAERGGRVRGENLRRDLLLRGFGESRDTIRNLIVRGWLVALPNPGEHAFNLNEVLEQEAFLQRDLAVLKTTYDRFDDLADDEVLDAPAWSEASIDELTTSTKDLELNLLHLCSLIRQDPLKLNKDGTPNRRSLGRVARGVTMPGYHGEVAGDLDLHDAEHFDYLTFIVSLARELQLLVPGDDSVCRTDDKALERFFHSDGAERDRRLLDALQRLRFWNEIDSLRLSENASRNVDEEHFSQQESTGQPLIGARGFVVSVLRRAHFDQWVALDALAQLCTQLDRHYLERTLSQLRRKPDPDEFIRAVLERTLVWAGILELGSAAEDQRLARLTDRGARALGLDDHVETPPEGGCLIAQPNFEVMVFLENAPITVLHELYRVGERRKLSDRVATFQLVAESVQRGYALGADSDALIELLNEHGHAPLPEAVSFELQNWERVHQRLTIHLGGASLRHPDPEKFDLICGQLEHDLRDSDAQLIRLGPRDAFVTDATAEPIERTASAEDALILDALGAPPRSFYFVDPLVLMVDPYELDVATQVELKELAVLLEDESSPRNQFWELKPQLIRQRFPDRPLEAIADFLDARCDGGLPAAQSLRLQSELQSPPKIHMESDVTVLTFEDLDAAERFKNLSEAPDMIARRLGPRAFAIHSQQVPLLEEILDELHLEKSASLFD